MNTAQVTAWQHGISVKNICPCVLPMSISLGEKPLSGLKCQPSLKSRKPLRVCSAGGKGMSGNADENSPWKSITKAMEKFKGQSIEDLLRQQIQKGEYFDNGGSGGKSPGGGDDSGSGGGSAGGGGPGGAGGPEEESFSAMMDENLQVILATSALLFLYIYLLTGEELIKVIKDYIKYLFGGGQSIRLKNVMVKLGLFYKSMAPRKEADEYWLEKAILNTPTWWYDPKDFRRAVRNYYASTTDSDE